MEKLKEFRTTQMKPTKTQTKAKTDDFKYTVDALEKAGAYVAANDLKLAYINMAQNGTDLYLNKDFLPDHTLIRAAADSD